MTAANAWPSLEDVGINDVGTEALEKADGLCQRSPVQSWLRCPAVLLGPALGTGQAGDVHDVVCDLDYALTGQDWPAAYLTNGVFGTQRILPGVRELTR